MNRWKKEQDHLKKYKVCVKDTSHRCGHLKEKEGLELCGLERKHLLN